MRSSYDVFFHSGRYPEVLDQTYTFLSVGAQSKHTFTKSPVDAVKCVIGKVAPVTQPSDSDNFIALS